MRLLLETHVFLWYISADSRLPIAFRDAIRDPANAVYLSVASVWETVIKSGLGKLTSGGGGNLPPKATRGPPNDELPVEEATLWHLANLAPLHRDPFDRILIAQALQHGLTLITVDAAIRTYPFPSCRSSDTQADTPTFDAATEGEDAMQRELCCALRWR